MDVDIREILDAILTEIESGKLPEIPQLHSRLDITTNIFEMSLSQVGIEPFPSADRIPPSQAPLAGYLRRFNVSDDVVDAILSAASDEGGEEAIHEIIEAVGDTSEIYRHGDELEHLHRMTDHSKWVLFWEREFGLLSSRLRRIKRARYPSKYWRYEMTAYFFRIVARFLLDCGLSTKEVNTILLGLFEKNPEAQHELKRIVKKNLLGFALFSSNFYLLGLVDDNSDQSDRLV